MTRAVRNRVLKDVNGDINDHLRNHIHLTNCIHLKNHMHKHSPILADRSLMRDLVVLQRSRSLRDPSASPPSWHSPSIFDFLARSGGKDTTLEGRRSVGIERPRQGRRLSGTSPQFSVPVTSKVVPRELYERNDTAAAISERSSKSELRDSRRVNREEYSRKSTKDDGNCGDEDLMLHQDVDESLHDLFSGKSDSREKKYKEKGKHVQTSRVKTLSEQLDDMRMDSDDLASSNNHPGGGGMAMDKHRKEPETGGYKFGSTSNRVRRRRFRGARRTRASVASRDTAGQNELSVASNSLAHESEHPVHPMEEGEDYGEQNITRAPRNGCGIPWNWSRIHDRGRTFLDMAGRSLSCGLSDRKSGPASRRRDVADMPVGSDNFSSSTKSDAEALPLLIGSQESSDYAERRHDYSGELGIFADHLLRNDMDSDLASEARSGNRNRLLRGHRHRHQNLTQKYMPQTFRDLVGQNLVVQALSNAVSRRKIGLLYVFYGPHGTGKTSCARIFAKALNCQHFEHLKPCGYCDSCILHDMGKNRNIKEVGPVGNFDFESIMDLLDSMIISKLPKAYRVFILDDCDALSSDCWSAISKVIDRAPRRVVFILVCSNLDVLPHAIISRCQKFFFPKLKDADIIYTLQWISTKENLEIDADALKLIASRSDGSLRDAMMTLEQLSLLGQRISVTLVQELVGLICDEKLVDLLDLALSADTVNTVKNLRVIMETGVEPLALMSQLATVITDILAGSYDWTKERHRRKFFRRQPLSKEDMEKLRQALKTLSEAEKQLRLSNDKLTWLTAALLQLAPDQQYVLPNSSAETSFVHSPSAANQVGVREPVRQGGELDAIHNKRGASMNDGMERADRGLPYKFQHGIKKKGNRVSIEGQGSSGIAPHHASAQLDIGRTSGRLASAKTYSSIQELWLEALEKIQAANVKQFLFREGKLVSVSFGAAPNVQLMFSSHSTKSMAEKFGRFILQAFEATLGSPVTVEIRCESNKDTARGVHAPLGLPELKESSSQIRDNIDASNPSHPSESNKKEVGRSEIVEMEASPLELKGNEHANNYPKSEAASNMKLPPAFPEKMKSGERNPSRSIVRGKVSLAHVIQQAEGCSQHGGWSRRKAVSIAEKLEQENLRLEPRSRNLLCWKASRAARPKVSRLKIRVRRPHSLLKLVSCGKCLSGKSSG